jgi:quercetin dioxygenase-like cupin family protein
MKHACLSAAFVLLASPLEASEHDAVIVKPVLSTSVTASGQPLSFPKNNAQVRVSTYEIAPGAALPEHKHVYLRYGYVMAGTLVVTNTETGKSDVYHGGDFIIEAIGQWHKAANVGTEPVLLLVIDQAEKDQNNVIMRE